MCSTGICQHYEPLKSADHLHHETSTHTEHGTEHRVPCTESRPTDLYSQGLRGSALSHADRRASLKTAVFSALSAKS